MPVNQLRPDMPPGVAAVVSKLMAKKPEDRFQTPGELAEVLSVPLANIGTGIVAPHHNGSTLAISALAGGPASPLAPLAILVTGNAGTPVASAIPLNSNGTLVIAAQAGPEPEMAPWHRRRGHRDLAPLNSAGGPALAEEGPSARAPAERRKDHGRGPQAIEGPPRGLHRYRRRPQIPAGRAAGPARRAGRHPGRPRSWNCCPRRWTA